jgi:EF hand
MKAKLAFVGALVTVCLIGLAIAQPGNSSSAKSVASTSDQAPPPPPGLPPGPPGRFHPPQPLMMALDTDKDGELSAAEIAAASASLLTLDADGDGILKGTELRPAPPAPPKDGEKPKPGDQIMRLDTDKDGYVTFAEFTAPMKEVFTKIDTNKDNRIDKDEAAAAPPMPPPGPGPRMGADQRKSCGGQNKAVTAGAK